MTYDDFSTIASRIDDDFHAIVDKITRLWTALADLTDATKKLLAVTQCPTNKVGKNNDPTGRCGQCPWCHVYTLTREEALLAETK